MADNFLERQREEYEARKNAMLRKRKSSSSKHKLSDEMERIREERRREHL